MNKLNLVGCSLDARGLRAIFLWSLLEIIAIGARFFDQNRRFVISFAAAVKNKCHQTDAEGQGENDAERHGGIQVADYSWAHQEFGGVVIPTLRRALTLQPDRTVIAKPVLLDVEIFDAAFE
jgi:hypothetical protein